MSSTAHKKNQQDGVSVIPFKIVSETTKIKVPYVSRLIDVNILSDEKDQEIDILRFSKGLEIGDILNPSDELTIKVLKGKPDGILILRLSKKV